MQLPLLPTEELDLIGIDRNSILTRSQTLASQVNPAWSDFSLNYPENFLIENQARLFGMMKSVLNERARQLYWATLSDRLAAIRKGRPTGFNLTPSSAALVDGYFSLPNSALATVAIPIPIGTRVQSGDLEYQTLAAGEITIGSNVSATLSLENSENQSSSFTSSNLANIVLQLQQTPYIDGSLVVVASDGAYTNVNPSGIAYRSFLEAGPDDKVFIALVDNSGLVYVLFGNGVNGSVPQGTIACTYKTGGGEYGRVSATATWRLIDSLYDANGNIVTALFTNPAASVGGSDAMTVEEARVRAPMAFRTRERSVNEDDYEYAAISEAGIATAALMTSNHSPDIGENQGVLYCVAYGTPYTVAIGGGYYPPATPTASQLAAIAVKIARGGSQPGVMRVPILTLATDFYTVDVAAHITKTSGTTGPEVKAAITKALYMFFAVADDERGLNTTVDFGYRLLDADGVANYELTWSDIFNAINDAEGVRSIPPSTNNLLLNAARASITVPARKFPIIGTITIYDDDASGAIL